nr:uncharacterized protein LOC106680918 [Halyomorpha halys]
MPRLLEYSGIYRGGSGRFLKLVIAFAIDLSSSVNMFKQILFLFAVAVVATSLAKEYPPGISPALCPDYPFCDNRLIALYSPVPYTAPGFPANVNPAGCPNYPYCN